MKQIKLFLKYENLFYSRYKNSEVTVSKEQTTGLDVHFIFGFYLLQTMAVIEY